MAHKLGESTAFQMDLKFLVTIGVVIVSACGVYFSVTGQDSKLQFDVNNVTRANLFADRLEAFDIMIQNNEITTTTSNIDLVLGAPGTGSVKIKDHIEITETPGENDVANDPAAPSEGIKLYSKTMSTGGSGLFFINKSNTRDEMVSKNKALVYSMVF